MQLQCLVQDLDAMATGDGEGEAGGEKGRDTAERKKEDRVTTK